MILLYHRVTTLRLDPWQMCVSASHFSEHLEVLKRHFVPVTLKEMVDALSRSKPMKRWVAVTLDDGYSDSLESAQPLLERHGVPATVFVATGALNGEQEFWWDELESLLLYPGRLPAVLSMTIERKPFEFELADFSEYSEGDFERHERWTASHGQVPTRRHALFLALYDKMRPLPPAEKTRVLRELRRQANRGPSRRPTHRSLDIPGLKELATKNCADIGAHTVSHPFLSTLPFDVQRREITECKDTLEAILGARVDSFAYPHGGFTGDTAQLVREAGFRSACGGRRDILRPGGDRFALPRIEVPDVGGERFDQLISVGVPR